MQHYYPTYYKKFRCIAASCPDSCCQGWDVVIDSDTEAFYQTVQEPIGDRLRAAIMTDSDGDRIFRLAEDKKCPFWGEDKLCDIYKALGEEHLCTTCARFPRIHMDYTAFAEHTLALACPEAARLITAEDDAYAGFPDSAVPPCDDYPAADMRLLLQSRAALADILRSDRPLTDRLIACLRYADDLSPDRSGAAPKTEDLRCIFDLILSLEYIDEGNRNRVAACRTAVPNFIRHATELTRLGLYYLYRYYPEAIGGMDTLFPIKLTVCSLTVIAALSEQHDLTIAQAAQLYSKEAEQSYENMELLYDELTCNPDFSVNNLLYHLTKLSAQTKGQNRSL